MNCALTHRTKHKPLRRIGITAFVLLIFLGESVHAQIVARAVSGEPFGVGSITVNVSAQASAAVESDDRFVLQERNGRILYPATESRPMRRFLRQLLDVGPPSRLTVYFLFQGQEPLDLTLFTPEPRTVSVVPVSQPRHHSRLLQSWWREYSSATRRLFRSGEYPVLVENYLTATLARRLNLALPSFQSRWPRGDDGPSLFDLMFGSEAMQAAIARKSLRDHASPADAARTDLPVAYSPPPLKFADLPAEVEVEPIALRVPRECFYVRFGEFTNYLWLRAFLDRWGGDLGNMIALRGADYGISQKLERQLAMRESSLAKVLGPTVIEDLALIGTDPFVHDGAALGILLKARSNLALAADISRQRSEAQAQNPAAQHRSVEISGHTVSFLSTPDNRMRSFYATDGNYHLVSTSRSLVEKFFATADPSRSLGGSDEFRWARTVMPVSRRDSVFVYVSDAFFRELVSPGYRIEMIRRMRARADLDAIQIARLVAKAEGVPASTLQQLVEHDLLPRGILQRADDSHVVDDKVPAVDSLRGAPGTFLPIPDVPIDSVTSSERHEYEAFAQKYRSQWERMDPVIVGIQRTDEPLDKNAGIGTDAEHLRVDVHVTPYVPRHFAQLARSIGAPKTRQIAPIAGDLVSVQGVTSGRGLLGTGPPGNGVHAFGGLRDFAMPFLVRQGEVKLETHRPQLIRGYVGAWPRPGLLEFLFGNNRPQLDQDGYARVPSFEGWHRKLDDFFLFSFKRDVIEEVAPQLQWIEAPRAAQIRLEVADPEGTQLATALNALGYMRARQTSASGSRFINSLTAQLHVPPEQGREVAEDLLGARLVCALRGDYELVEPSIGPTIWTSNALDHDNRFFLAEVPADYEFPFLQWFRGGSAELQLTDRDLAAHIEIAIERLKP